MNRQNKPIIVASFILAAILAVALLLWPEKLVDPVQDSKKQVSLGLAMQAANILVKQLGADRKLIAELWPKLDLSVTLHQPLVLLLESQARWALREGLVDGDEVPDYTSYMHMDTLRDLKPEAVTVIR